MPSNSNYIVENYIFNSHIDDYYHISSKFLEDDFVEEFKKNLKTQYSDDNNLMLRENCYPNYMFSPDTTVVFVKNSIYCDFSNIGRQKKYFDLKNIRGNLFLRTNKITDLTYLKNIYDNSEQKQNLKYSFFSSYKIIDAILLKENSLNLTTLTNLEKGVYFDKELILVDGTSQSWTQNNNNVTLLEVVPEKPFYGQYNPIYINLNFNSSLSKSPFSSSYQYRDIVYTPPRTGQYKISFQQSTTENPHTLLYQGETGGVFYFFTDYINFPTTKISDGYQLKENTRKWVYLQKGVACKMHVMSNNSSKIANIMIEYNGIDRDNINLTQLDILFEDAEGKDIFEYVYNGNTYSIASIKEKINGQILNIQTQLVMFDIKGVVFEDHEKYAINTYCSYLFKFVNSIHGNLYKLIKKSIEIKE